MIAQHSAPNTERGEFRYVHPDQVLPWSGNPRKHFDEAKLHELAESVRSHGLQQPPVVRPVPAGDPILANLAGGEFFYLIMGERRWRACKLARMTLMPVRVRADVDDHAALELALIENLHRADLDPIEEAEGYAQLNRVVGLKQADIARSVNRSQPVIANAMRLLELPEDVRELIRRGTLSVAHGVALAKYAEYPQLASAIAGIAVTDKLTSKDVAANIPSTWDLSRRGIIVDLEKRAAKFDLAVCKTCPLGAYRKGGYYEGLCLRPDHYAELQQAAEAAEAAKLAEAEARGEVRDLATVGNDYRVIDGGEPMGCTEDCPCRRQVKRGKTPLTVCCDGQRYRDLIEAQRAVERAARVEAMERRADAVRTIVRGPDLPLPELLAVVAARLLVYLEQRSIARVTEERGIAEPKEMTQHAKGAEVERLGKLRDLGLPALIGLLSELVLVGELRDASQYPGYGTDKTDWLLGVIGSVPDDDAPEAAAADD